MVKSVSLEDGQSLSRVVDAPMSVVVLMILLVFEAEEVIRSAATVLLANEVKGFVLNRVEIGVLDAVESVLELEATFVAPALGIEL